MAAWYIHRTARRNERSFEGRRAPHRRCRDRVRHRLIPSTAMSPERFYVTTAIAYANNKPGLHTLYEVVGADVIARWHRMKGDDTRFLTGTDEHSVNIAQRAAERGRDTREFVEENVALFRAAEDALLISPDRFIRTSDPDHVRAAQEFVRRAYAKGDIYSGIYEGWYCPAEGFKAASDVVETPEGTRCPNHPTVALEWLTEHNWFFRLSAYQERLEKYFLDHPDFAQPDYRRNEMLGFIRGGLEDFSCSRSGADWGIPFPIMPDGSSSQLPDGTWNPDAGTIYVWYDALINYATGAGFPDDPAAFEKWWPADLHVIGKDIARFHTIYWPAMLWSAGLDAPRRVWIHGFLLAQGERMSKSLGNFLDPIDVVKTLGADGARYVTLREVAFDRDTDVSWDSFVRRYNADLANDFGNLVNRSVSMGNRYFGGERPAVGPDAGMAAAWSATLATYREKIEGCLLHEALSVLWEFVGAANRLVEAEQPWSLAKAMKTGDAEAETRLRAVIGDLVESCRLVALAAAPFMPQSAPRALTQLGYEYQYAANGVPLPAAGAAGLLDDLRWGAHAAEQGKLGAAEPLFPRLETEAAAPAAG
jgi:methionyl-tRNA synthetase